MGAEISALMRKGSPKPSHERRIVMNLNWSAVEKYWQGQNPVIETFETELGKDNEGTLWFARAQYRPEENRYMVWFDTDKQYEVEIDPKYVDEGEDTTRWSNKFLRPEVIYSNSYWRMHDKFFSTKRCKYEDIQDVVEDFINAHNIEQ